MEYKIVAASSFFFGIGKWAEKLKGKFHYQERLNKWKEAESFIILETKEDYEELIDILGSLIIDAKDRVITIYDGYVE